MYVGHYKKRSTEKAAIQYSGSVVWGLLPDQRVWDVEGSDGAF
jgi:hypothetical protein